jgi:hypothetical protein
LAERKKPGLSAELAPAEASILFATAYARPFRPVGDPLEEADPSAISSRALSNRRASAAPRGRAAAAPQDGSATEASGLYQGEALGLGGAPREEEVGELELDRHGRIPADRDRTRARAPRTSRPDRRSRAPRR